MPVPAAKKRRVYVDIEDSGEDASPLPPAVAPRTRAATRRLASSTASATGSSSAAAPTTASPRRAASRPKTTNTSKPKPSSTSAGTTSSSAASTEYPVTAQGRQKSLYPFFATSQRAPSGSASTQYSVTRPLSASQHEDLDDLIEDLSDEGSFAPSSAGSSLLAGGLKRRGFSASQDVPRKIGGNGITGSQNSQNKLRNAPGGSLTGKQLGPKSFTRQHSTLANRAVSSKIIDTRPWPERYAPKTSADLAVHIKKISDVRSWLEHVFDGFSKQRVLVLKGSAGTGKTATIDVLSREMGFEILEWQNPSGAAEGSDGEQWGEGAFSGGLSGIFEEFLGTAGRFGTLEMVSTASAPRASTGSKLPSGTASDASEDKKKVILIEDFPNTLFTSSSQPLESFRHAIKSFLALPISPRFAPPLSPLVLIISETATIAGPDSFTAHRLLSPEILNHPLVSTVTFNKIAATFMIKALSSIITAESRESGRKWGPSRGVLEGLSTTGDIRSAVMGLQFLSVRGEDGAFSEKLLPGDKKRKKKQLGESEMNDKEKRMLEAVTQREASLGIFHAVGKVVYNKRYGDDPSDPYHPAPPRPPLLSQPYKNRTSRIDVNTLIDEIGTDTQTFISAIHENYLPSINLLGGLARDPEADPIELVNQTIDALSDSDLLASPRAFMNSGGLNGGFSSLATGGGSWASFDASSFGSGTAGIRADEISFQVAVLGTLLALPTPVKREARNTKIFYPMSLRLWRDREEVEGLVDKFITDSRRRGCVFSDTTTTTAAGGNNIHVSTASTGRAEMVLERLPYIRFVSRANKSKATHNNFGMKVFAMSGKDGGSSMRDLERITVLKGVGGQSEDVPDDDNGDGDVDTAVGDELVDAEEKNTMMENDKERWRSSRNSTKAKVAWTGISSNTMEELPVEKLVLSDDDIED